MRHALVAAVCGGLLLAPAAGFAQSAWFDLAVPGSLEQIAGVGARSLGPSLLRDLIGVFHDPAVAIANRRGAEAFRECLGDVQRLRARWSAVRLAAGEVGLRAATAGDDGRRALEELLDLFDLRLQRDGGTWRVAPNREEARRRRDAGRTTADGDPPDAADQPVCGAGAGWRSAEVERRLNAGGVIAWNVPQFTVSLPLSPQVWLTLVYEEDVDTEATAAARIAERAADLVGRLVTDPRAAQLYVGLSGLDDRTLGWLRRHPRALSLLTGRRLEAFAQFGGGFRVHDGEVRVPGGAAAAAFWEGLVDAPVADPERFLERLLERSSARVARAYDLVSRLPDRRQRFVLGAWQPDARDRRRSLETLWRVLESLPQPAPRFADARGGRTTDFGFGDRLNERICGVPAGEAVALTWQMFETSDRAAPERFFACGPIQCTSGGQPNESTALDYVLSGRRGGELRYVCEVEAVRDFFMDSAAPGGIPPAGGFGGSDRTTPARARLYRLGYPLTGRDQDVRRFIVR